MPAPNIAPAYLQDLAAVQGSNASTDYFRYQNEIDKQKREMEAEKRRRGSFGQRMLRGAGGAIKGGLMGAMTGNPYAAAGAAAAGFAGGALDDGSGQMNVGTAIGQSIPLAAMVAGRGASYLSSGSTAPGFSSADVANEFAMGNLKPSDLQMLRSQGYI